MRMSTAHLGCSSPRLPRRCSLAVLPSWSLTHSRSLSLCTDEALMALCCMCTLPTMALSSPVPPASASGFPMAPNTPSSTTTWHGTPRWTSTLAASQSPQHAGSASLSTPPTRGPCMACATAATTPARPPPSTGPSKRRPPPLCARRAALPSRSWVWLPRGLRRMRLGRRARTSACLWTAATRLFSGSSRRCWSARRTCALPTLTCMPMAPTSSRSRWPPRRMCSCYGTRAGCRRTAASSRRGCRRASRTLG
mmetsp:Transcript_10842/g.21793  ORF Transcript_10842/g.21793 Transcript_10842/m.21793 type:complete len:252 (+) Transcript_10842:1050-1805(+)